MIDMSEQRTYPTRRIKRLAGSMKHRIEVALLEEIDRLNGRLTTARFLFYRLVEQLVIKKERKDINPKTGKPVKKQPISTMYEVLTDLRWAGVIPFGQIVDDGRAAIANTGYQDLLDAGREAIASARFDPWDGGDPPQIWVEDAGTGQVLRSVTRRSTCGRWIISSPTDTWTGHLNRCNSMLSAWPSLWSRPNRSTG